MSESQNRADIAVLKEQVGNQAEDISDLAESVKELADKLGAIASSMANMKGFVAGFSFAFSLIGGAFAFLIGQVAKRWI